MNTIATRCFLPVLTLWLTTGVMASDWPMYKHDAWRSGVTDEKLTFPMRPAWTYTCPQPPAPAWPPPFRLLNRMDFDYAPALVIADGLVCFGSSADDTLRALDVKTGSEKWRFITGAPVRFAPQIEKGKVYFGSDDGYVYCLDAATGKLVWKFNAAPADERFIGNHRMISRWPIRTGALVADGVLYCVAGMWPAEGIFIYALDAATGKVVWCNDTLGGTPQGALLLGGDVLLMPNGNAKTTPLDRRTGKLMQWPLPQGASGCAPGWLAGQYAKFEADPRAGKPARKEYLGGSAGRGGTWATLDRDKEYSFVIHRSDELAIEPYSLTNGLAERTWWGAGPVPQLTIQTPYRPNQIQERGKVSAIVHKGKLYARNAYGLALAGDTLLLGHDGAVTAEGVTPTNKLWRADVKGEARDLAVADGRLFVSTSDGVIHCFEPGGGVDAASPPRALRDAESGKRMNSKFEIRNSKFEIAGHLHSAGMDRGFALVLGDTDGKLSLELAARTQLRIINALSDESAVASLRERLLAATAWHGSRIHVQHVARLDALPFPQFFANAVIVAGALPGLSGKELYRVLRPCGGIMLFPGLKATEAEALVKETSATESEIRALTEDGGRKTEDGTEHSTSNIQRPTLNHLNTEHRTLNTAVVRGKLPGSLDWDQEPGAIARERRGSDQLVKWPLRLLWFGGPTTRQTQHDIEGAPEPTPANGRYFKLGERALTAVDAYNGAVLWSRPIPEAYPGIRDVDGLLYSVSERPPVSGRPDRARGIRVNNESVFLTLSGDFHRGKGGITIQMDALTGEQKKVYSRFNPPTLIPLKTSLTWLLKNATDATANKPPAAADLKLPGIDDRNKSDPLIQAAMQDVGHALGEMAITEKQALAGLEENDGCLTLTSNISGLCVKMTTRDASVTPLDAWNLYFDFRPVEARYGLYERGTFHIRIVPAQDEKAPPAWRLITGPDAPKLDASGARNAQGTETTVVFAWTEIEKWLGEKPASFDFAATLNTHGGLPAGASVKAEASAKAGERDKPIARRHLFGDWTADGINNGWARIVLNDSAGGGTGAASAAVTTNPPAIMGTNAPASGAGAPVQSQRLNQLLEDAPGIHPLTGEPVPKIYGIAPVCGGAYGSAHIISQASGLYDLGENGGRHPCYPGVKTGCTTPQMAAFGLFLISEEWGHCVCNYPFRGSLVLAPSERRLNEDWTSFYDRDVDTRVRHAFVNLGAPGDRRDEKGNLWLKFPRDSELRRQEDYPSMHHPLPYPLGMRDAHVGLWPRRPIRSILWLPLDVDVITQATVAVSSQKASGAATPAPVKAERSANFGPYRFNTDRVRIQGADRPWIYGSGYRGIRKATLKLDFFKPLASLPAAARIPGGGQAAQAGRPTQAAITVDGKLDEATWGDELNSTNAAPALPYTGTRVAFRHDAGHLYVGLKRPPMTVVKRGPMIGADASFNYEPVPWRTTTNSAPDAISNRDNWWRLIVSDASARKVVYLTVTPNGTRADALRESVSGGTNTATNVLNSAWNGSWKSAVEADTNGMTLEMAIPWTTLEEVGLKKDKLAVNFLMNDPGVGTEALTYLGVGGYDHCSNFTPVGFGKPAPAETRQFTARLHFAEPDEDVKAGQRVFDVILQGRAVLKDFDIVKEAGGARKAVVKEFPHVSAAESLTIEFKPRAASPDDKTAPVLSGLEVVDETWAAAPIGQ